MCGWKIAMCAVAVPLSVFAMSGCDRFTQDACAHYGGYGAPISARCTPVAPSTQGRLEWEVEVYERYGAGRGGFGSYRHLGGLGTDQYQHSRGVPQVIARK